MNYLEALEAMQDEHNKRKLVVDIMLPVYITTVEELIELCKTNFKPNDNDAQISLQMYEWALLEMKNQMNKVNS